ncbi:hypothetical protein [Actinomadura monticuli]|uniref:Lipoprotein n=1 Tax=Actinomadura monticuli TaxID=3097367 RepID=A0ABV4Q3T5_9ACTN
MKKVLFVPVAAAALALGVSACGGSDDDAGDAAPPTAASTSATQTGGATPAPSATDNGGGTPKDGATLTPVQREMLTKLRDCMVKKGYGMPEVTPGNPVMAPTDKNGKSDEQVNKDAAQCFAQNRPTLPAGG